MATPKHPELTTLTACLAKLDEYLHKHEDDLPLEGLHSLTGAIMALMESIELIKAGV